MPPTSRLVLGIARSTLVVDAIRAEAPIGWNTAGKRCRFNGEGIRRQSTKSTTKKWTTNSRQQDPKLRLFSGIRFASAWRRADIATSPKRSDSKPLLGALFGASALAYLGSSFVAKEGAGDEIVTIHANESISVEEAEDAHKIRLADVTKHDRNADSKWIIRETGVYDITNFIEQHPGGEVILRACGGSIDAYWKLFSIHQKPEVYDILKQYYIGEIDDRDLDDTGKIDWNVLGADADKFAVDDPFKNDPKRDERLVVHTATPCNAETPGNLLVDFLTPIALFFVRHHFWVPQTHEAPQSITIELSDGEEKTYSLQDLKSKFREHTITATLQCSGNRRAHMSKAPPGKTSGLQWDIGAISTAEFSGVRLRDVLKDAGYCVDGDCAAPSQSTEDCDKHIHFQSPGDAYAVSIPLQTGLNPQADVLIAWNMNGEPINQDHGGPLRAVVPGTTAARSVKWLGKVSISCDENESQWQKRDYKCFGPGRKASELTGADWEAAQSIQETPVQSAITNVLKDKSDGSTSVQGFAFSGGGRRIERVDVSADGGRTWRQAELGTDKAKGSKRWAWTLWKIDWMAEELTKGGKPEFVVKATDESYNTQPQTFESTWNFRGLLANAWHRVSVDADA